MKFFMFNKIFDWFNIILNKMYIKFLRNFDFLIESVNIKPNVNIIVRL